MREPIEWAEPTAARDAFIELALLLGQHQPMTEILGRLVGLAQQTIRPAKGVSLMRLTDDGASHLAGSGDLAGALDRAQHRRADGPSIRAALSGEAVHVPDLRKGMGWPDYAQAAIDRGAVSCFAVPVPAPQVLAALTVYGGSAEGGFDFPSRYLAARFACYAAAALGFLSATEALEAEDERADGLDTADPDVMASDHVTIGKAVGVVMERHHLTADQALAVLGRAQLQLQTSVLELATKILNGYRLHSQHLHPSALGPRHAGARIIPLRGCLPHPRPPQRE